MFLVLESWLALLPQHAPEAGKTSCRRLAYPCCVRLPRLERLASESRGVVKCWKGGAHVLQLFPAAFPSPFSFVLRFYLIVIDCCLSIA